MPSLAKSIASYLRSKGIYWARMELDTHDPRIAIVVNEGGTKLLYASGATVLVDELKNFGYRSRLVSLNPSISAAPWLDAVFLLMGLAEAITDAINSAVSNPFAMPTMIKNYLYGATSVDSSIVRYMINAIADFLRNGRPRFVDLLLKAVMNWSIPPNPPQITSPPPIRIVFV